MALKIRIALFLAIFTSIVTIVLSAFYGVRIFTILYRGAGTAVLFGIIGYIIGSIVESYLEKMIKNGMQKGQKIDIIDQPETDIFKENLSNDAPDVFEFKALTPDDFMSFSTTQK